jgi:ribosomal protein S12 methylthiotransferase
LISYGCAKNLVDSEVMLGYLEKAGYEISPRPDRADIIVLNTCGFIRPARDEAGEGIEKALALKGKRLTGNAVVGCFVESLDGAGTEISGRRRLGVKDFDLSSKPRGKILCSRQGPIYWTARPRASSPPPDLGLSQD